MSRFIPGAELAQLTARQTRRGSRSRLRSFRVLIVAAATLGGFVSELGWRPQPFFLEWHAGQGAVLLVLAVIITVLAFAWSRSAGLARGARWWSVVALLSVLSAAMGGYLFVMSGFANGSNSAQMGGSFIAAYASYFMTLYYTK